MGNILTIKPILCMLALQQMRAIEDEIQQIRVYDCERLLLASSGETVEEIKKLVTEAHELKEEACTYMKQLTDEIEDYVKEHVALDKRAAAVSQVRGM